MVKSLDVDGNKQKKKAVEDAVFIGFLNTKMEETHTQSFKNHYALEIMTRICVLNF